MSNFIVPLSSLPPVASIDQKAKASAATAGGDIPFAGFLEDAIKNVMETNQDASATTYDLAMGNNDDLHTGAVNSLKYSTAVSFASSVTSAVVRAYNELIRMQV